MTFSSFINRNKSIRKLHIVISYFYSFYINDVYYKKKQNFAKAFQFLERAEAYA